jgi:hypothetical protein
VRIALALLLGVGLALVIAVRPSTRGPSGPPAIGSAPSVPPAGAGSAAAPPGVASDVAGARRAGPSQQRAPAVTGLARRFLDGWVRWEVGSDLPRARALIAQTASPALARVLLGQPPIPMPGLRPRRATIVGLRAYRGGRAWSVIAELRRGAEDDAVLLGVGRTWTGRPIVMTLQP